MNHLTFKTLQATAAFSATLFLTVLPAFAQDNLLGKIEFPTSGVPEAQADFIEGMLYMHNFEYDEAAAAFKRAQEIDSDFAMAYWGEAMTYHHPLWGQQARVKARDVLRKLGRTSKARSNKAGTQREKDFLLAAETLFGMTDASKQLAKPKRDVLYRDAMRRMHETYPDDHEAATLYGLSILGVGSGDRDFATYMRAAAELTEVWDANRMHPGAAHYLIHSYDDPTHAPLGLPMARAYSKIAPAAAHAQHMTSHIFLALGMWDDLVDSNEIAIAIENEAAADKEDGRPLAMGHYVYWLEYGYLQQGRYRDAGKIMEAAHARLADSPKGSERSYYGSMYVRHILDTEAWESAETWAAPDDVTISTANYYFALAFAALKRGDIESAREHSAYVEASEKRGGETSVDKGSAEVLRKELDALFALAEGDNDRAVALAREAVDDQNALAFSFGPPQIAKPSTELLADILLEVGETEEAAEAYKDQLVATPGRTNALLGLARAAKAHGDAATASDAYHRLATIWHAADSDLPAVVEARSASGGS